MALDTVSVRITGCDDGVGLELTERNVIVDIDENAYDSVPNHEPVDNSNNSAEEMQWVYTGNDAIDSFLGDFF